MSGFSLVALVSSNVLVTAFVHVDFSQALKQACIVGDVHDMEYLDVILITFIRPVVCYSNNHPVVFFISWENALKHLLKPYGCAFQWKEKN